MVHTHCFSVEHGTSSSRLLGSQYGTLRSFNNLSWNDTFSGSPGHWCPRLRSWVALRHVVRPLDPADQNHGRGPTEFALGSSLVAAAIGMCFCSILTFMPMGRRKSWNPRAVAPLLWTKASHVATDKGKVQGRESTARRLENHMAKGMKPGGKELGNSVHHI